MAVGAGTSFTVIKVTAGGGVPGNPGYTQPCALMDSGGYFGVACVDTTPAAGGFYDVAGANKDCRAAFSLNSVHIVETWHDGTNLKTSVDGGATTTTACGSLNASAGSTKMGANYNDSQFLTGTIYELAITNTALSSGDRTSVRQALATKYGVTIP